jgi:hypothetical protein
MVHLLASRFGNNGFDEEGNLWNGTASWKWRKRKMYKRVNVSFCLILEST